MRSLALPLMAVAAQGCGDSPLADPVTGLVPAAAPHPSVVIQGLEWEDVTELRAGSAQRESTRGVGFFAVPTTSTWCTAVLVAPDAVATAAHCVDEEGLDGATVAFRRETGIPEAEWASYPCATMVARTDHFALVSCIGQPGATHGVPALRPGHLAPETDVYVVQQACNHYENARCQPAKRVSAGTILRARDEVWHDADALQGSLGAPMFARRGHELVALHLGGVGDEPANRAVRAARIRELAVDHALELGRRHSVFGAPPPPPDPFEPNNTLAQATLVTLGFESDEAWVAEADQDVFELRLSTGTAFVVEVLFSHSRGDIDVAVFAGSLTGRKLASGVSADDNENIRVVADATGAFFVVVYGYQGAVNEYDIKIR